MELTFSAGTTRNCLDIPIEDDDILEGTENLFANLTTLDPDVILEPNVAEILVFEDPTDGMCVVVTYRLTYLEFRLVCAVLSQV